MKTKAVSIKKKSISKTIPLKDSLTDLNKCLPVEPRRPARKDDLILFNTFLVEIDGRYKAAYFSGKTVNFYYFQLSGEKKLLPPLPSLDNIYLL